MTGNWLTEDIRAWDNVHEFAAVVDECEREVKEEFDRLEDAESLIGDELNIPGGLTMDEL